MCSISIQHRPPAHVMRFTFRGSRSKDNDTRRRSTRGVKAGRRTRQGDCCVTNLPKRKREGKSEVTKVGINRTSVATRGCGDHSGVWLHPGAEYCSVYTCLRAKITKNG